MTPKEIYVELTPEVTSFPPLDELINHFKNDVEMIIGTGSTYDVALKTLKHSGITHNFTDIISVDKVSKPKPNPETFLKCAEVLNLAPQQCLVFEDGDMGIEAAIKANINYIDVRPFTQPFENYDK